MRYQGLVIFTVLALTTAAAARVEAGEGFVWGVKASVGGRYDDVRMCIATDPGVKGGVAAEIALAAEVGLVEGVSATIHLPIMRPVLFGLAFNMLQFEPDVFLNFRHGLSARLDLIYGPTLGLSLHYGPDYNSGSGDEERGPSFFALGPKLGLFVGLNIKRPGQSYDFVVGINPYVTPLFAIMDATAPDGVVAGGMLEGSIRFGL